MSTCVADSIGTRDRVMVWRCVAVLVGWHRTRVCVCVIVRKCVDYVGASDCMDAG